MFQKGGSPPSGAGAVEGGNAETAVIDLAGQGRRSAQTASSLTLSANWNCPQITTREGPKARTRESDGAPLSPTTGTADRRFVQAQGGGAEELVIFEMTSLTSACI
jgi:hypothetical protein